MEIIRSKERARKAKSRKRRNVVLATLADPESEVRQIQEAPRPDVVKLVHLMDVKGLSLSTAHELRMIFPMIPSTRKIREEREVQDLMAGEELEIIETVNSAYMCLQDILQFAVKQRGFTRNNTSILVQGDARRVTRSRVSTILTIKLCF